MELAAKKWESLSEHKSASSNLYDYEKGFDELCVEFGREVLEGSVGKVSKKSSRKRTNWKLERNEIRTNF